LRYIGTGVTGPPTVQPCIWKEGEHPNTCENIKWCPGDYSTPMSKQYGTPPDLMEACCPSGYRLNFGADGIPYCHK
jgi:hypothetical protein